MGMADAVHPSVWTIPAHRSFADALARGLLERHGDDALGLARGLLILPNSRAVKAVTDGFIRVTGKGALLPRMIVIGDEALDERLGVHFDPLEGAALPPAISPLERLFVLAEMVGKARPGISVAERFRLARSLGQLIDQMQVEELGVDALATLDPGMSLADHWQETLGQLDVLLHVWPAYLASRGLIDATARRNLQLHAITDQWRVNPPSASFIIAAGITTSAPAIAGLLRTISRLPQGGVVLPALDLEMDPVDWTALGPFPATEAGERPKRPQESHPQYHLKRLLDRMGVGRGEVEIWPYPGLLDSDEGRDRMIAQVMLPPPLTTAWSDLDQSQLALTGIHAHELAHGGDEAQLIAIAIRHQLETPRRTVALVTPDRILAQRVTAHLRRWDEEVDDSAGVPLADTVQGALLLGLVELLETRCAPVPLVSVLQHPLAMKGERRQIWLDRVRGLDKMLRGPRPAPGLGGILPALDERIESARKRHVRVDDEVLIRDWWQDELVPMLTPASAFSHKAQVSFCDLLQHLVALGSALTGEQLWAGPVGRRLGDEITRLRAYLADNDISVEIADARTLLVMWLGDVAIRPADHGHPRVFIWGLLEARLQRADLMILGGLNEGSWPAVPTPDPWLSPGIRRAIGLPSTEFRIGLAAHDFATALGARRILMTRARRQGRSPMLASRFWRRLEAMTGGLREDKHLAAWAHGLDRRLDVTPRARQPRPQPPLAARPGKLSVTAAERALADPYAFYAYSILKLRKFDPLDAPAERRWMGTIIHEAFELWVKDGAKAKALEPAIDRALAHDAIDPVFRMLARPRLMQAAQTLEAQLIADREEGRTPCATEAEGEGRIAGVIVTGKADRIDRLPDEDGNIVYAIVDYKSGKMSKGPVVAGNSLQLGLLGEILEQGGFKDLAPGKVDKLEYWSLARGSSGKSLGHVIDIGKWFEKDALPEARAVHVAAFEGLARRWLLGDAPFIAKEFGQGRTYDEYDQLMRLDEWLGRDDE